MSEQLPEDWVIRTLFDVGSTRLLLITVGGLAVALRIRR